MNKKLLTAAIAAAVALPMAAQAGVTIYGKVHVSLDWTSSEVNAALIDEDGNIVDFASQKNDTWTIESGPGVRDSRIGFKGAEDLGNGLKAIWKFESQADFSDGTTEWGGRNAYVGLAGDWGTVFMGRHDTPLKISTGKLDYFADTLADYNSSLGFEDIRAPNVVAYISPAMAGLTFAIAGHTSERTDDADISNGYSAALMYSNNGLFGAIAYEDLGDSAFCVDPGDDCQILAGVSDTKWRAGLGWEGNNFGIAGVYESQSDKGGELFSQDGDIWQVSAKYKFGNNAVKGMFGQNDYDGFDNNTAWAIGFDHNLSKRTMAYLLYAESDFGLRGSKTKPSAVLVDLGDEVVIAGQTKAKGFSLGMVHKF